MQCMVYAGCRYKRMVPHHKLLVVTVVAFSIMKVLESLLPLWLASPGKVAVAVAVPAFTLLV